MAARSAFTPVHGALHATEAVATRDLWRLHTTSRAGHDLPQHHPPGIQVLLGEGVAHLAAEEAAQGRRDGEDPHVDNYIPMAEPDEFRPHGQERHRQTQERAANAQCHEDLELRDLDH